VINLDPRTAIRLAKLLGRLGSHSEAERATAAAMADKTLRDASLTWEQLVSAAVAPAPQSAKSEAFGDARQEAAWVLANLRDLTVRERSFLLTMKTWAGVPSAKQRDWLDGLTERARAGRSA
jgi:hypothetical protein